MKINEIITEEMNRRGFLRGLGAAAVSGAGLGIGSNAAANSGIDSSDIHLAKSFAYDLGRLLKFRESGLNMSPGVRRKLQNHRFLTSGYISHFSNKNNPYNGEFEKGFRSANSLTVALENRPQSVIDEMINDIVELAEDSAEYYYKVQKLNSRSLDSQKQSATTTQTRNMPIEYHVGRCTAFMLHKNPNPLLNQQAIRMAIENGAKSKGLDFNKVMSGFNSFRPGEDCTDSCRISSEFEKTGKR